MANTSKDKQNYQYVHIAELKSGVYNTFGVVKFSKVPVRSRGTDFVQVLSITDDSLAENDKLVISLFYSSPEDFPPAAVGDIIRLHRLRVESVNGELKGRPGPGFSWLLVHDDVDNPRVSSKKYTYTNPSKLRVRELQQWAGGQGWVRGLTASTPLSDLVPSKYCDLVCQVMATAMEQEDVCFVARVWDGTCCPFKVAGYGGKMTTDAALEEQAGSLAVDIWIYDDHVASCRDIQPGQFIKLTNLHAAIYKGEDFDSSGESTILELTLHRGTSYGRGVIVLDLQSPQVATVRERLDRCLSGGLVPTTGDSVPGQESSNTNRHADQQTQNQNASALITASVPGSRDPTLHESSAFRAGASCHTTVDASGRHTTVDASKPGCSHWSDSGGGGGGDDRRVTCRCQKTDHPDRGQKGQHGKEGEEHIQGHRNVSAPLPHSTDTSTTPSMEDAVPSLALQASADAGSENNPVVISSSSAGEGQETELNSVPQGDKTRDDTNHQRLGGTSGVASDQNSGEGEGCGGGDGGGGSDGGGKEKSPSNKSSYPDNELSRRLSSYGSGSGGKELPPSLQSSTETCMLQTASVVCGHQHVERTSIREVLGHAVPAKFRVLAHLVGFSPDSLDPRQFVRQLCSHCYFLATPHREKTSGPGKTDAESLTPQSTGKPVASLTTSKLAGLLGGRLANWNPETIAAQAPESEMLEVCPRCQTEGRAVPLELTYMLRLVLQDSSGHCLVANLWRDSAVTFLRGVSPEVMLMDGSTVEELVWTLRRLCVGDQAGRPPAPPSSLPPRLDCCLFSYTTPKGVNFHMFDTALV